MIMMMNGMRKKRHRIIYEDMDIVSENEAKQLVMWAEEFVNMISDLIHRKTSRQKNPN